MSEKYAFNYEPVSVYANAVTLIKAHRTDGAIHVDIGCGNAAIAEDIEASGKKYIGFDFDRVTVDKLLAKGYQGRQIDLNDPEEALKIVQAECQSLSNISCITMLDVVEHLTLENRFLEKLSNILVSSGNFPPLILSVPNFAHFDVAAKLLGGRWDYRETGLLDRTHLTVYTETLLHQHLQDSQWTEVEALDYKLELSDQFTTGVAHPIQNRSKGLGRQLRGIKEVLDKNANTHQFVRCYKPTSSRKSEACPQTRPSSTRLSAIISVGRHFEIGSSFLTRIERLLDSGVDVHIVKQFGLDPYSLKSLRNLLGPERIHTESDNISRDFITGRYWTVWHNDDIPSEAYFKILDNIIDSRETTIWRLRIDSCRQSKEIPQPYNSQLADDSIFCHPANAGPNLIFPTSYLDAFRINSIPNLSFSRAWIEFFLLCHLRIGTSDLSTSANDYFRLLEDDSDIRFLTDEPDLIECLDDITSNVWPNSIELKEWLSLPTRITIRLLENRVKTLESESITTIHILENRIEMLELESIEKQKTIERALQSESTLSRALLTMRGSFSWKITAPLRSIKQFFARNDHRN